MSGTDKSLQQPRPRIVFATAALYSPTSLVEREARRVLRPRRIFLKFLCTSSQVQRRQWVYCHQEQGLVFAFERRAFVNSAIQECPP